tara:strand:+ start:903 stop:1406 length:504 start_codon:yes stop_codon:yes gene_type:complete
MNKIMLKKYQVKLLKLSTAEDIIAEVDMQSLKTSEVRIKNPQKIVMVNNMTHMGMSLVKWLPWNFGEVIPINKKHIVAVTNTAQILIDYFNKQNARIKDYKGGKYPEEDASQAMTGEVLTDKIHDEETEERIEKTFKEIEEDEQQRSKLDEIMDEVGVDPDDKKTIH